MDMPSVNREHLLTELTALLGEQNVQQPAKPFWPSWWPIPPLAVVFPPDVGLIGPLVCALEAHGVAIVPFGGGTRLITGYAPARPFVLVSSQRLTAIVDYQPDDLTVTVQPGISLANLQSQLAAHRQRLPLDVPLPHLATMGGIVASAQSGFMRASFGTPRDLLIGMRAVMSEGVLVRGGGRVVKNVAGYDTCKLFTGSWGTLGLLTELTFKVQTAPQEERALAWDVPDLKTAAQLAFMLHRTQLAAVGAFATNEITSKPQAVLLLQGTTKRVNWQAETFSQLAKQEGITQEPQVLSPTEVHSWRDKLARLSEQTCLAVRISCLPSEVGAVLGVLESMSPLEITVDCACGLIDIATTNPSTVTPEQVKAWLPSPRSRLVWTRLDPTVPNWNTVERWGPKGEDFFLHQRIKATLDPKNTFSPARFIGGL